jgi:hypothetical protein
MTDFSIGAFRQLPPNSAETYRRKKYSNTKVKLAQYLQFWISRELDTYWQAETAHLNLSLNTSLAPLTTESYIPIPMWNTTVIPTFPLLNIIRTESSYNNKTVELLETVERYEITHLLPPTNTLEAADLFTQIQDALIDVIVPAINQNTIDFTTKYFTKQDIYDIKCQKGTLKLPGTENLWVSCVMISLVIRSEIGLSPTAYGGLQLLEVDATINAPDVLTNPAHQVKIKEGNTTP